MRMYANGKGQDIVWNSFIDEVKADELNEPGGFPAEGLERLRLDHGQMFKLSREEVNILRKLLIITLKGYRELSGDQKEKIKILLLSHGEYCRNTGSGKMKRVNNVLAYRYTASTPMTNRMIGHKMKKCKEQIDNDLMAGQLNLVMLCCGYPAADMDLSDPYHTTASLLKNYMILEAAEKVTVMGMFPEETERQVIHYQTRSREVFRSLGEALKLCRIFCSGYGGIEARRYEGLKSRRLEHRTTVVKMCEEMKIAKATADYDLEVMTHRIAGLLFGKQ